MSIQGDPRLMIAHWADEATRAENDAETLQARAHRSEDKLAAAQRAAPTPGSAHGLLARIRGWTRGHRP